ncbi:MAG: hypothetical protein JNL82_22225 [Myxococcales bacterium]|nr:hypothetical protein [Myxococcales bacterium]
MPPIHPAVVTGTGAVSGAGRGAEALWAAAAEGRDVLAPIRRFAAPELAGVVPELDDVPIVGDGGDAAQDLCVTFAEIAAREALAAAGLDPAVARVALIFGTNLHDHPTPMSRMAAALADRLALAGPRLAVSTACASSTTAIALALHLLRDPAMDAVLAGGADVLTPLVVGAFRSLRLLAPDRCAPFSTPVGLSLGEGAAFLVLERPDAAAARGRAPIARLNSAGLAADAFHPTSPDPRGEGVAACIHRALARGGLAPADIAYVNAHATGTDNNDLSEWRGLVRVFGARATELPVSASKSILGHAQGAAGALEAVLTLQGLRRGLAPPTLRHVGSRPGITADAIAEGRPRRLTGDAVVSVNTGFGGACAALLFTATTPDVHAPPFATPRAHEPVGASTPTRPTRPLDPAAIPPPPTRDRAPSPTTRTREVWLRGHARPDLDASAALRNVDTAGMDPGTRALVAAAYLSLGTDASDARAGGGARVGLFVAQPGVSPSVLRAGNEVARRRGYDRVAAVHTARGLLVSSAGACATALGLRGPLAAFSGRSAAALAALTLAADEIAGADDVAWMLAAAVDEPEDGPATAGCVALADTPDPAAPIALVAHRLGPPGSLPILVRDLLVDLPADTAIHECGPTLAGLLAAITSIRIDNTSHAVVVADDPDALACATVWRYSPPSHA